MNLQAPTPHINRHILETLFNSGAPQVCTLSEFGPDSAFEVFQALMYMQEHGWVERVRLVLPDGHLRWKLSEYGAHLVQLGLVIENAGAVDDDPGDVSEHFLRMPSSAAAVEVAARQINLLSQQHHVQPKAVNHEGGTAAVATRKPPINSDNAGAAQSSPASAKIAGRLSGASRIPSGENPSSGNGASVQVSSSAEVPKFDGNFLPSMTAMVEDKLAKYYAPCPQGDDCVGDGQHRRLFDCVHGCGFHGCVPCIAQHEAEPHWGDSQTAREMVSGNGGQQ